MRVACSLAHLPFLFVFYLHLSTLGVAIEGAMSFSSQRKIAGSRRVLITAMDDGQVILIALAPSRGGIDKKLL
jgi:hypothetical protein